MTTNFPLSLDSFTTKIDNLTDVMAADVNNLQDAVAAIENTFGAPPMGWVAVPGTVTYVSATSFTISGDLTAIFKLGVKVRLVNSTTKYGYVLGSTYSSPNTTVNLVPNSSYSLISAAITGLKVSYAAPPDFPEWFNYVPTLTNLTLGSGTISAKFRIRSRGGAEIQVLINLGSDSVMGTSPTFSLPVAAADIGAWNVQLRDPGVANYVGTAAAAAGVLNIFRMNVTGSYITYSGVTATAPFTWGSGDAIYLDGFYGI